MPVGAHRASARAMDERGHERVGHRTHDEDAANGSQVEGDRSVSIDTELEPARVATGRRRAGSGDDEPAGADLDHRAVTDRPSLPDRDTVDARRRPTGELDDLPTQRVDDDVMGLEEGVGDAAGSGGSADHEAVGARRDRAAGVGPGDDPDDDAGFHVPVSGTERRGTETTGADLREHTV